MFFIIPFLVLLTVCCNTTPFEPESQTPRELTTLEKQLVQSDNTFGFKIFKNLDSSSEETEKNVFISPLSISMALGMTLNGADGETREAMEKILELDGLTLQEINKSYKSLMDLLLQLDPKVVFQIANSIWYRQDYSIEEEFIQLNKTYFDAQVRALDFNNPDAVDTINSWVHENTNGKIKNIVNSIDPLTLMFLINAIYFKGIWTYQFEKDKTSDSWFHLPDGSQVSCNMMTQEAKFSYFQNEKFQAIDLPYGDGLFSMTILLPSSQIDIDSLIADFNQQQWSEWMSSFSEQSVTVYIPRFKLEYELSLNDILSGLGMAIAFDPASADFTRMYAPGGLYIHQVKHKTFVEVNEEGTEAAAVTSVEMPLTSIGTVMRIDRPFVFMIRENSSQTILFLGKIVNVKD